MKINDESGIIIKELAELRKSIKTAKTDLAFKRANVIIRASSVANTAIANIKTTTLGGTNTLINAAKVSGATLDNATVVAIIKAM